MKEIYHAATLEAAEQAMVNFEKKWGHKYAYAIKSWKNNWENLTQFFEYPVEIRKIVYTTNIIESLNRGIRKYTKTKSIFPLNQEANPLEAPLNAIIKSLNSLVFWIKIT